ncbi:MAG: HAMP domain-containing histidine kinase [Elusimicrobiaceae bacterium]|nr:HAMP domain-containing histidine kinase [Elusimicrobiaceae bacterium]
MEEKNKQAQHTTLGDNSLAKDAATRVLSLVSHKLKTPLSIINGYSEAILSTVKPKEMSNFNIKALEDINKQGEKLSVLVDKLIRFANISDLLPEDLEKKNVNVKKIFSEVSSKCILRDDSITVNSSDNTIRRKAPTIEIKCENDTTVHADGTLLAIAIEELVDNAIRFNNNASKKLRLFYYQDHEKDVLAVADNGVGIREEHITKIFHKFYQIDDFFTGQIEGWGLGLALVKRIMNLHGGNITVRSQYGVGTIISLVFPKINDKKLKSI